MHNYNGGNWYKTIMKGYISSGSLLFKLSEDGYFKHFWEDDLDDLARICILKPVLYILAIVKIVFSKWSVSYIKKTLNFLPGVQYNV